jgi:hypothetical protein
MELLADIIRLIHYLVVIFVLTAHSLLPIEYIKYYLLFVILIFLDWNDMDGQCILTKLEFYFRTGKWNQGAPTEGGPEFFRPIFNKLFKKNLTTIEGDRLNNFIFIICWGIAFFRIYYKL